MGDSPAPAGPGPWGDCEARLGYRFVRAELLQEALTHASVASTRLDCNQRLEFLGDAVLGLVVSEYLFQRFPDQREGELTRMKSAIVSRHSCADASLRLGLDRCLVLGKGVQASMPLPQSILADVFESLLGAVYLDGGIAAARTIILQHLGEELERAAAGYHGDNFKSLLQQLTQREFGVIPLYSVLEERGPDHSKMFHVGVLLSGRNFEAAWGRNKKEAEQLAACNALRQLLEETQARTAPAPPVAESGQGG